MSWASARATLESSNLQQAATSAFICLLISLLSVFGSVCLLDNVMHSHVSDMLLNEARSLKARSQSDAAFIVQTLRAQDTYEKRPEYHSVVVDAAGKALYGASHLIPLLDCQPSPACKGQWRRLTINRGDGRPQELLGLLTHLNDGSKFFAAYDLRPMLERTQIIPLLGGAALFTILLGSLAVSLRYSLHSLARIDLIRDALQRFASGDHRAAPPQDPYGDEIDQLGVEINSSLTRINNLMTEVRNVTSHIAHELRTPLTRLQNRLVSAAEKTEGEIHQELLGAVAESERLHSLFRAVMRIGEVESGRCAHTFEQFAARELLEDLHEYYLPLAEQRGSPLLVHVEGSCLIKGDRDLLFQALANMTDNALKYSPPGATVELYARRYRQRVEIGVADHGPGIAADKRNQATDRFQRLDTANMIEGHGLGLTLVKAIAELHSADLSLQDNDPGLRIALLIERGHRDALP